MAASSFAVLRYFGWVGDSVSAIAQVRRSACLSSSIHTQLTLPSQASVAAAVEHLRSAVIGINGNVDAFRRHADLRFDTLQQRCDIGFERVNADIAQLQVQVTGVQLLQQRQLESSARLEESMSMLVNAANGLRAADARDVVRPLEMQALIGGHAARQDRLMQMRSGALLRA